MVGLVQWSSVATHVRLIGGSFIVAVFVSISGPAETFLSDLCFFLFLSLVEYIPFVRRFK